MKFIFISFLIYFTFAIECENLESNKIYTVDDAFECIESVIVDDEWTTQIQEGLEALFETYVFKDILKNPPQPSFNSTFYKTVDIDERLADLDLNETSVYSFMQQIQSIVNDCRDYHLSFRLTTNGTNQYYYDQMFALLPFVPDILDGNVVLYKNDDYDTLEYNIPQEIIDNVNVPVETINGMKPLEFIRQFAEKYTFLKTPHGRFTYAMETMYFIELQRTVIDKEYLNTPIEIVYSNGVSVTVNYSILYVDTSSLSERKQQILSEKRNSKGFSIVKLNDLIEAKENIRLDTYDHQSLDGNLACKIDTAAEMNVLVLKTFYPTEEIINFFVVMNDCIKAFDENAYPISLILPMNGGGSGDLVASLEKTLAPQADADMIGSVRISDGSVGCIRNEYGDYLSDPATCEVRYDTNVSKLRPLGEWYTKYKTAYYGDVEHNYSQESFMHATDLIQSQLEKNPRKPTDIVVFTDGFCYSACSVLTKKMVETGSAIVVGFEGDPEGQRETFDAGNSPTAVITQDEMFIPEVDLLKELGGTMRVSFLETFPWNFAFNEKIPREFLVHPVDEKVEIYKFMDNKIGQFIEEGKKIIAKYETECNPNNKRLVKFSDECDSSMTIEHAHGGYVCGDDGKWTTTCAAAYCDEGYKFDYYNQQCIIDTCYEEQEESSESLSEESYEEESSEAFSEESYEEESSEAFSEESYEEESSSVVPEESSTEEESSSVVPEPSVDESSSVIPDDNDEDKTFYIIIASTCGAAIILILIIIGVIVGVVIYKKRQKGTSEYALIQ